MTDQHRRAAALIGVTVLIVVGMIWRGWFTDRRDAPTRAISVTTTIDPAETDQCYQDLMLWTLRLVDTRGGAYADARRALGSGTTFGFAVKAYPTLMVVQYQEGEDAMMAQADGGVRAFCDLPPGP